ncbi:MAG: hypothetical protein JWO31_158, partial [Phycisphaerales bacterium]|nr:hypothetical protein [Phycisphaerales bacterium]
MSRRHPSPLSKPAAAVAEALERRSLLSVAFAAPVSVPAPAVSSDGGTYQRPVVGDFDGDAKADLILSISSPTSTGPAGYLYFAKGNGDGTFATPTLAGRANFNFEPAAGDFNGDGRLDIAVADYGADTVHVLAGNGDGTLAAAADFPAGDGPFQILAADFDTDGRDDVAVGNRSGNTLTVRLGDPTALLGVLVTLTAGTDPASLVAGDFNSDGNLDRVVGNFGGNNLSAFAGRGDGTFAAAVTTAGRGSVVDVSDVNEDGKLDVVRGVDADGSPLVSLGNGDLTFRSNVDNPSTVIASAVDVDGDGHLDLVTAGTNADGTLSVLPGNGNGTFGARVSVPLGTSGRGTAADLNGDGLPDLAYVGSADAANYTLVTALAAPTASPPSPPTSAANLTVAAVGALPATVIGGAAGKLTVRVTNAGTEAFAGTVPVRLLASADGVVDVGDAVVATQAVTLSLKPGKSKGVKFKFAFPALLPTGAYTLLAQIDPTGSAAQSSRSDDVATAGQVTITAPVADLAVAFPSPLAA